MSAIPEDLKYSESHEWVRVADGVATVGVTDHAQAELTDVVFVELPEVGATVQAGESCMVVESVKTASDVNAPVSGEVVEVNQAVADDPALVNTDPYGAGYLFKVRMSDPSELDALMDASAYEAHIAG
jgi:glycine cleavage system H protein